LAPIFEDLSQGEKLSEIKPSFVQIEMNPTFHRSKYKLMAAKVTIYHHT
jgi:hypothetical protein